MDGSLAPLVHPKHMIAPASRSRCSLRSTTFRLFSHANPDWQSRSSSQSSGILKPCCPIVMALCSLCTMAAPLFIQCSAHLTHCSMDAIFNSLKRRKEKQIQQLNQLSSAKRTCCASAPPSSSSSVPALLFPGHDCLDSSPQPAQDHLPMMKLRKLSERSEPPSRWNRPQSPPPSSFPSWHQTRMSPSKSSHSFYSPITETRSQRTSRGTSRRWRGRAQLWPTLFSARNPRLPRPRPQPRLLRPNLP